MKLKRKYEDAICATAWCVLGLAMLFCWSLTVHNWTKEQLLTQLAKDSKAKWPIASPSSAQTTRMITRVALFSELTTQYTAMK